MADPVITSPLDMSDTRSHIERINEREDRADHLRHRLFVQSDPPAVAAAPEQESTLPVAEYEDAPDIEIDDDFEMDDDIA